jgi:hypothetical protein
MGSLEVVGTMNGLRLRLGLRLGGERFMGS